MENLYGLINQVRYQRQPFCQLKILVEGDPGSDKIMASLLVLDQRGFMYAKDFAKLQGECAAAGGGRLSNPGVPQGYY